MKPAINQLTLGVIKALIWEQYDYLGTMVSNGLGWTIAIHQCLATPSAKFIFGGPQQQLR